MFSVVLSGPTPGSTVVAYALPFFYLYLLSTNRSSFDEKVEALIEEDVGLALGEEIGAGEDRVEDE